jgi:DNA ligase D-like protein (predicted ligase)/DNA ligase D-like protein (predicted polymerase)/DNA ligase D-like protein (predicted 3'-phosphoesterase)
MSKKQSQWVTVGRRKLELSNLEKVLFPDDHILKAEVIEYYLNIAPTILHHIRGRALTLIRFPDGIAGETFYQKNRPEWAPDWLEFATLGKEAKDYIVATEPASLVWLANLAALELHQLHSRKPEFENPDYMVFDLDPPEGYRFENLVAIASDLRAHLEQAGYSVFVKTTGGKGVHLCCPLQPKWDFKTVFETARALAGPFVEREKTVTLHLKKEWRQGRVLIDIYRNRPGQSIVSPYSLRGRTGAPVSMPLSWDEMARLKNPQAFTIRNAMEKVRSDGDAWAGFDAEAAALHTHRAEVHTRLLPPSRSYKSAEQLKAYQAKRDFSKTPEPAGAERQTPGNRYVIHRHHASHLHYDLRLEQNGVLKSWAVPKGLPPYPGVKRLAVQTEDHPIEYLHFDGKIPKGQYGAGEMWIFSAGRFAITKEKKDGFYFRLSSKELNGTYRIYKIKEKEWLLERVDEVQTNYLHDNIEPMLADASDKLPAGHDYLYEVKWDGIRALVALEDGQIRIRSRNHNDITARFPELQAGDKAFRATCGLFDAEIVCLDNQGRPDFKKVINRLMTTGDAAIEKAARTHPACCYLFDCLYLDGRPVLQEPLTRRKTWLQDAVREGAPFRVSEPVSDGEALLEAARLHGLEGIMAKRTDGKYAPGKRSADWVKVKFRATCDVVIAGYTPGQGERSATFGGLHVAEAGEEGLIYRGKVGTGFDEAMMKEIHRLMSRLKKIKKPFAQKAVDEKTSVWIEPVLKAEVRYAQITRDGLFREPVFVRLRPDC